MHECVHLHLSTALYAHRRMDTIVGMHGRDAWTFVVHNRATGPHFQHPFVAVSV